jgi:hypothetical protein
MGDHKFVNNSSNLTGFKTDSLSCRALARQCRADFRKENQNRLYREGLIGAEFSVFGAGGSTNKLRAKGIDLIVQEKMGSRFWVPGE